MQSQSILKVKYFRFFIFDINSGSKILDVQNYEESLDELSKKQTELIGIVFKDIKFKKDKRVRKSAS